MAYKHLYVSIGLLLLLSCGKTATPVVPSDDRAPGEMLLPAITKAAVFDATNAASLETYRAVLLDSDFPWRQYAAEGTYCNIYKYPGAVTGEKWYHALRCDALGNPYTDEGAAITSWGGSEGAYLANGSVPEFQKGSTPDTWGDSRWALWADNSLTGVSSYERAFRLWVLSPAKALRRYLPEGKEDVEANYRYGLEQKRTEKVSQSPTTPVILSGTYLRHYGKESQYVYQANRDPSDSSDDNDLTLMDHRSRLSVKVYVDEVLDQVNLKKIVLSNFITEGIYFPIDETSGKPKWIYDYDGSAHLFTNPDRLWVDENGDSGNYDLTGEVTLHYKDDSGNVNAPTAVFHDFYLLSQDYSELDAKGHAVHPLPTLNLVLLSNKGEEVAVDIPLSWDFAPMHHYKLTLRIATWYIYVYVTGSDWQDETDVDLQFGFRPDLVFYVENPLFSGNNWENGGSHDSTI